MISDSPIDPLDPAPAQNRDLMVATVLGLLEDGVIRVAS